MKQLCVYLNPLPREPPSHRSPTLPSRSSPSTELAPCAAQQLPTSYLVCAQQCTHVDAAPSVGPTLPFPRCLHVSVLHICVSIPVVQISSFVLFFYILYIRVCVCVCVCVARVTSRHPNPMRPSQRGPAPHPRPLPSTCLLSLMPSPHTALLS